MSFNAGGTNVGGVQAREQGQLKLLRVSKNITEDATYVHNFVVPQGKIWVIKAISTYKDSGTYTVGSIATGVFPTGSSGGNVNIDNRTGTNIGFMTSTNIALPYHASGAMIRVTYPITGWSVAGNYNVTILYQELDE